MCKNIETLMAEHQVILRNIAVMRKRAIALMKGEDVDMDLFTMHIEFARHYADKHHHGKEEQILFEYMTEHLGATAEKLIGFGMLVEHDLGRLYVGALEDAVARFREDPSDENRLDIVGYVVAYSDLLRRHIEKEDQVVYNFGIRGLSEEQMAEVEVKSQAFDEEHKARKEKYERWIEAQEEAVK